MELMKAMQESLKFELTVSDAVTSLTKAIADLSSLETKLADISINLGSDTWSGSSYAKCVDIHALIIEYAAKLKPCCDEAKSSCDQLVSDVNSFQPNSTNVTNIGNW